MLHGAVYFHSKKMEIDPGNIIITVEWGPGSPFYIDTGTVS